MTPAILQQLQRLFMAQAPPPEDYDLGESFWTDEFDVYPNQEYRVPDIKRYGPIGPQAPMPNINPLAKQERFWS